jgi:hypothetical protein
MDSIYVTEKDVLLGYFNHYLNCFFIHRMVSSSSSLASPETNKSTKIYLLADLVVGGSLFIYFYLCQSIWYNFSWMDSFDDIINWIELFNQQKFFANPPPFLINYIHRCSILDNN